MKEFFWIIIITCPVWLVTLSVLITKSYYEHLDAETTKVYLHSNGKVLCPDPKMGIVDVGICKYCVHYKSFSKQQPQFIRCKYLYRLGGDF